MIDRRLPIRGKLRYHATARAISEVLLCKYAVRVSQRDIYAGMISTLGGYRHKGSDPGALAKELRLLSTRHFTNSAQISIIFEFLGKMKRC